MDNQAALETIALERRRRNNALALMLILTASAVALMMLWASGMIVFIPIVVGVLLYALIARFFFHLFGVPVAPRPAGGKPGRSPAGAEEN
ncbi:MAG: hypothetical protein U1E76_09630 [Planctomycetota bacterium]